MPGPALAAALHATTPEVLGAADAYDALVIGAGAAGGLAALLLTKAGLRVLVLEAGRFRPLIGSRLRRWELGALEVRRRRQPIQSCCYAWSVDPESFVDDLDCLTSLHRAVPSSGCALGRSADEWWSVGMAGSTIASPRAIFLAPMD
jgi:hypothetical protein